ncbi:hypothetical protein [Candidatus Sororendozoicomonas aggregata]|uniref:hypothetical protein n=1 Tax=Candidatus Sororendozoicomonas aggregata TaxID=3073239 RepID=UPI002ED6BFB1
MHKTINTPVTALLSPRYRVPAVRDYLASQYVLGCLHPLTRKRLERLLLIDPSWWALIETWQCRLQTITPETNIESQFDQLPSPPERVWETLQHICQPEKQRRETAPALPWWRHLLLSAAFASAFSIGVVATVFWLHINTSPTPNGTRLIQPAKYLAMMSAPDKPNHFALVAYQGDKPGQSSLRMQRNLNMKKVDIGRSMVWVRNGKTGELSLLSSLQQVDNIRYLTSTEWKSLTDSSELIVTENANPESPVIYQGTFIALKGWS